MSSEPGNPSFRQSSTQLDFHQLLDALPTAVVVADSSMRIVYLNRATERLLGWPQDMLLGQPIQTIQPQRFHEGCTLAYRQFLDTGISAFAGDPIHLPGLHRDGHEIPLDITLSAMDVGAGVPLILSSMQDARERLEMEQQVKLNRSMRAMAQAASTLTSLLDFEHVVQTVIDLLVEDFGASLARIWITAPHTGSLYLRAEGGPSHIPDAPSTEELFHQPMPLWLAEVIHTHTPFIQNGLDGDQRFDQRWVTQDTIASVVALPLLIGDELQGVMALFYEHPIAPDEVEILVNFASIVTASLHDVQLYLREHEARAEAEESQRRFAFLAEASHVMAASLDRQATLERIAQLAVPDLADWCILDVLDENGALRELAIAHSDPDRDSLAREYRERYPAHLAATGIVLKVIRTGKSTLLPQVSDGDIVAGVKDDEQLAILRDMHLTSYMCVPLAAHNQVLGAMTFMATESHLPYGSSDLLLAEELGRRAALALENASLYHALQETVRLRDEFLSSISHDLKNPITAVKGRANMLLRRVEHLSPAEAQRFRQGLESIEVSATRMTRLINDVVDVARLHMGQALELSREPIDLIQLAREAAAAHGKETDRHTITVQSTTDTLTAAVDRTRMERVLVNLLNNATSYSPDGGEIVIEICPDHTGQNALISVRDQGMGIPEADIPHVFERFYRGSNVSTNIPGDGIGLAGVHQIIDQHGGTIQVDSREGAGAAFTVSLPL